MLAIHAMKTIDPVVAGTLRMATSFVFYAAVVLPAAGGLHIFAASLSHTSFWLVAGASMAGAASYLTYYAANHLVGASRAMPLNSLYAVWAIVFSIALLGLHPTPQLVVGRADQLRRRGARRLERDAGGAGAGGGGGGRSAGDSLAGDRIRGCSACP